uniref:DNA repair protein rad5 n=1 Tax=Lygus hesperus TaxID=30085 RepID=A0A0A9ZFF8_LYGHE
MAMKCNEIVSSYMKYISSQCHQHGLGMQYQTKRRRELVVLLNLWRYHPGRLFFMLLGLLLTLALSVSTIKSFRYPTDSCDDNYHYYVGFYGSKYPVPNIVHFYRGGREAMNLTVSDVACIEAALRLQGPVYIHTDDLTAATKAAKKVGLESRVTILPAPVSSSVTIPDSILWVYGGVFMRNDVYLLRNINIMRSNESSRTPRGDIVASTPEAARASKMAARVVPGVLLEKDWGALYIMDVLKNCSVRAVRLGTRNDVMYHRNLRVNPR